MATPEAELRLRHGSGPAVVCGLRKEPLLEGE